MVAKTLLLVAAVSSACGNTVFPGAPSGSYGAPPPLAYNGGYSYDAPNGMSDTIEEDPIAALGALIPGGGVPGEDYPILASVPDTGFSCEQQEYLGYFADTADEAGCQVFHICQFDGRQDSFLCPNGTILKQQHFVCDWWFNVDCAASQQFFGLNAEIGKVPEDNEAAASDLSNTYGAPQEPSQKYGAPQEPSQQYGAPQEPSQKYGAPQEPSQQYGAPQEPSQQYGAPQEPSQQHGAPQEPSQQYGAPQETSQQYGAPQAPSQQYGAPQEPSQQYGAPQEPPQQYGAPQEPSQQYGAPQEPSSLYDTRRF